MVDVAHSTLTGSDLHEPKAITTAGVNTVYVANGSGSGTWQLLNSASLTSSVNPFGSALLHAQEQQAPGVNSATPLSFSGFVTRAITTLVTNEISGASLSLNQIHLPPGLYFTEVHALQGINISAVNQSVTHRCGLFNRTMNIPIIFGLSERMVGVAGIGPDNIHSFASGRFALGGPGTQLVELISTNSWGGIGGYASSDTAQEIYSDIKIWKIHD